MLIPIDAPEGDVHNAALLALSAGDAPSIHHVEYIYRRRGNKTRAADLKHCRVLLAGGWDADEVASFYAAHHGGQQLELDLDPPAPVLLSSNRAAE